MFCLSEVLSLNPPPPSFEDWQTFDLNLIEEYIEDIALEGRKNRKVVSSPEVSCVNRSQFSNAIFFNAMQDIDCVFGYQKVLPRTTSTNALEEGTILVFIGPRSEVKKLFKEASNERARSRRRWTGYTWWNSMGRVTKTIIAIYTDDYAVDEKSIGRSLRESVMWALGYSGYTRSFPSFFNSEYQGGERLSSFSEYDHILIPFCDQFQDPGSRKKDVDKIVRKEWDDYLIRSRDRINSLIPKPDVVDQQEASAADSASSPEVEVVSDKQLPKKPVEALVPKSHNEEKWPMPKRVNYDCGDLKIGDTLYRKAFIVKLGVDSIGIVHDSGGLTIPYEKIPAEILQKFDLKFDSEEVTRYRKDQRLRRQD